MTNKLKSENEKIVNFSWKDNAEDAMNKTTWQKETLCSFVFMINTTESQRPVVCVWVCVYVLFNDIHYLTLEVIFPLPPQHTQQLPERKMTRGCSMMLMRWIVH